MSKKCLIISGGEFSDHINPAKAARFDYIIACDKGYEYAERLGIVPDLVIGDFDSYDGPEITDIPIITLPVAKDDTDTGFAAKYALEEGFDELTITCAMGGHFNHEFANIQTCSEIARRGAAVSIDEGDTIIRFICASSLTITNKAGWGFSVYSISDKCEGVFIKGALYSIEGAVLTNTYPLGEGNQAVDDTVSIGCSSGILMIVECRL